MYKENLIANNYKSKYPLINRIVNKRVMHPLPCTGILNLSLPTWKDLQHIKEKKRSEGILCMV